MKITDNVYLVPGVTANSYLITDPGGLTIVDTGLPYSEKRVLAYIARLGRLAGELRRILITHADLDHYGCLASLRKASGARTYAGRLEAQAIAAGRSSRPVNRYLNSASQRFVMGLVSRILKAAPMQVDEVLAEGQTLPVLGGLRVVETPGHSPGHLSYFAPSTGVLFCGDSMRSDGQKGLRVSRSRNDWDPALAIASARKQAELGAEIVCPGHGPVVRVAGGHFG